MWGRALACAGTIQRAPEDTRDVRIRRDDAISDWSEWIQRLVRSLSLVPRSLSDDGDTVTGFIPTDAAMGIMVLGIGRGGWDSSTC